MATVTRSGRRSYLGPGDKSRKIRPELVHKGIGAAGDEMRSSEREYKNAGGSFTLYM
jgi:hypothetical protein